jgi:hypothetical protein
VITLTSSGSSHWALAHLAAQLSDSAGLVIVGLALALLIGKEMVREGLPNRRRSVLRALDGLAAAPLVLLIVFVLNRLVVLS